MKGCVHHNLDDERLNQMSFGGRVGDGLNQPFSTLFSLLKSSYVV